VSRYSGGTNNYIVLDDFVHEKESNDVGIIRNLIQFGYDCLKSIIGQELDFYGAESQAFKVGDQVIEVLEDPDDGYRSHLGGYLVKDERDYNFYTVPFAKVRLEIYEGTNSDQAHGYRLYDVDDNHVWLEFGTDYNDDYYPSFVFSYTPKESKV